MSDQSSNPVVKYPGRGPDQNDAAEARRLERLAIENEMEELKTEQLRRQLRKMKNELDPPKKAKPRPDPAAKPGPAADAAKPASGPQKPAAQQQKPAGQDAKPADPKAEPGKPQAEAPKPATVGAARLHARHGLVIASFVAVVVLPILLSAWYLWARAEDRYASFAGFSIRTEEIGSALELLGGVAEMTGSSSSDTDILYKYIQSQELVAKVDAELDLRSMWSRPGWNWLDSEDDPVFAYHPPGTIEDLTDYWGRMVNVYSDSGSGLIDLEVQAFSPEDAHAIAQMIYDESSAMINRLSTIAREDATRYARDELDRAVDRLKSAREATTRFRNESQIVDPTASVQSQMGILSSLQGQLAQTLIEIDILEQTSSETDPRLTQLERRSEVIEARIEAERGKLGIGNAEAGSPGGAFADLMGEYERVIVDQEFAEQSYTAALAAYDSALAEAQRQTRYLAAHVEPTQAERSRFPDRMHLLLITSAFCVLGWAMLVLLGYSIRDRR